MAAAAYDQLSQTFYALSDPTRLAILHRLSKNEATVTELSKPFHMSMPAITKHLKVLEKAGLITREKDAQRRPCLIRPKGFRLASNWILEHEKLWNDRFDRLEDYLAVLDLQKQGENHDHNASC